MNLSKKNHFVVSRKFVVVVMIVDLIPMDEDLMCKHYMAVAAAVVVGHTFVL